MKNKHKRYMVVDQNGYTLLEDRFKDIMVFFSKASAIDCAKRLDSKSYIIVEIVRTVRK